MKKTFIAAAAAVALSFLGTSAYAADSADSVQIKAPSSSYVLATGEFDDYKYSYALSNGMTIRFSQSGNRYFAELAGEPRTRLYPRAPGVFETAAGTRVQFREVGALVAIDQLERMPMAQQMAPTKGTVIAAR